MEKEPLVTGNFRVYKTRFWVLVLFSLLSCMQSCQWITFSTVLGEPSRNLFCPECTTARWKTMVNLTMTWGPVMAFWIFVANWLLTRPRGVRHCALIGASVLFGGSALRCIALIPKVNSVKYLALALMHMAQMLNAAGGPFVMGPVTHVSGMWFPPGERTVSTAVLALSNMSGNAVAFVLQHLVPSAPLCVAPTTPTPCLDGNCPTPLVTNTPICPAFTTEKGTIMLMLIEAGIVTVLCLATWIHFPPRPPKPPSASSEMHTHEAESSSSAPALHAFWKDVKALFHNRGFVFLAGCFMLQQGVFAAWQGLFTQLIFWDQSLANWVGLSVVISAVFGGVAVSHIVGKWAARYFKRVVLGLFCVSTVFLVLFLLSVKSPFHHMNSSIPLIVIDPSDTRVHTALIFVFVCIAGLALGVCEPLMMEKAAEITHPVREGSSGCFMILVLNLGALLVFAIAQAPAEWVSFAVPVFNVLAGILFFFVPESYGRSDFDEASPIAASYVVQ